MYQPTIPPLAAPGSFEQESERSLNAWSRPRVLATVLPGSPCLDFLAHVPPAGPGRLLPMRADTRVSAAAWPAFSRVTAGR